MVTLRTRILLLNDIFIPELGFRKIFSNCINCLHAKANHLVKLVQQHDWFLLSNLIASKRPQCRGLPRSSTAGHGQDDPETVRAPVCRMVLVLEHNTAVGDNLAKRTAPKNVVTTGSGARGINAVPTG